MWVTEDRTAVSRVAAKANGGGFSTSRAGRRWCPWWSRPARRSPLRWAARQGRPCGGRPLLSLASSRATRTDPGADHQPAASPGDVLRDRERGVPVRAAELLGCGLLALADLPAVDAQVVLEGHVVDSYATA